MERIQTSEGLSLRQDPSKHAHDPNSIQMALGNEPDSTSRKTLQSVQFSTRTVQYCTLQVVILYNVYHESRRGVGYSGATLL